MDEAQIKEEQDLIELEGLVQAAIEGATVTIGEDEVSLAEGLKTLRKAYGVEDDARASRATVVGNLLTVLGHYQKVTFRTEEQQAQAKEAVVNRMEQEEEDKAVEEFRKQRRSEKAAERKAKKKNKTSKKSGGE